MLFSFSLVLLLRYHFLLDSMSIKTIDRNNQVLMMISDEQMVVVQAQQLAMQVHNL